MGNNVAADYELELAKNKMLECRSVTSGMRERSPHCDKLSHPIASGIYIVPAFINDVDTIQRHGSN